MRTRNSVSTILFIALIVVVLQISVFAQTRLANINVQTTSIQWEPTIQYSSVTLTVTGPTGTLVNREFRGGSLPTLSLLDRRGGKLGDGSYTYELSFSPSLTQDVREMLARAREQGNEAAVIQDLRSRGILPSQPLVESGSFSIQNGQVMAATGIAERDITPLDIIQPDDVITQGSQCVGLDCVNGEVFGFDTVRLKENNTRLQFDDTSTSAGFATNNWQIRANSSASGGASFLAFVDQGATGNSETGTIVFEVDAGAPANSLKVASNGKVGLRTATPVLDLHINTSDTPAHRLEQNSSGGFSAQTWDIAGNEANFFIRDVTGGSRLPFRIRPGAPTSSIDIAASGNVGIGIQTPTQMLHVAKSVSAGSAFLGFFQNTSNNGAAFVELQGGAAGTASQLGAASTGDFVLSTNATSGTFSNERLRVTAAGLVGINTTTPSDLLSVNGSASKPGGGAWGVFSDERLKNLKGNFNTGLKAVMQLQPLRYEYKKDNALGIDLAGEHVGFGAQSVQKVIPEAVSANQNGYLLVNNDPIIWTMLNAIKEQQKQIVELKRQVKQLRAASRRRR